jgi:hypothetical protein
MSHPTFLIITSTPLEDNGSFKTWWGIYKFHLNPFLIYSALAAGRHNQLGLFIIYLRACDGYDEQQCHSGPSKKPRLTAISPIINCMLLANT